MDSLIFSINAVMPLFLLVILGYVLKQIGMFTDEWLTVANKFSFKVTLSVLLFYNIYTTELSTHISPKIIIFVLSGILLITLLCYIIVPIIIKDRFRTGVVIQGIYRSNFLLFGMPLVINMFGDEAKPVTATLVAIVIPIYNLIAIITLTIFNKNQTGELNVPKMLLKISSNPLIVGSAFGYLFRGIHITMPAFMLNSLGEVAKIAVPLALIIVGGQFKMTGFIKNIKLVSAVVFTKLVISSGIMVALAIVFGFRGIELGVILTVFGSPCAVSSSVMAYSMDCDGELAGNIVVLGTLVSVITIFFSIFLLKSLTFI